MTRQLKAMCALVFLVLALMLGFAFYTHRLNSQDPVATSVVSENLLSDWDSLDKILPNYILDGNVGSQALALFNKLSAFRRATTKEFGKANGMQIDFIGNSHEDPTNSSGDALALNSQAKTRQILEQNQYDLVGVEGFYCVPITQKCLEDEMTARVREIDPSITSDKVILSLNRDVIPRTAGLSYFKEHPDSLVIGLDEPELHHMHFASLTVLTPVGTEYTTILKSLSEARTDIALAKTIGYMIAHGKHRAVITIGEGHGHRFEELARQLKLKADVYMVG